MANKNALTSIGLVVAVALEDPQATPIVRPTTNYYKIPGVTDLPDLDFDPDTIETTSYDNEEFKSYLPGLKDTGGVISLPANYTEYGVGMWDDMAADLEADSSIKAWLLIAIKGTTRRWFIPAKLVATGVPTAPVNDKVSTSYKFTVLGDIVKQTISDTDIASYYASGDYPLQ